MSFEKQRKAANGRSEVAKSPGGRDHGNLANSYDPVRVVGRGKRNQYAHQRKKPRDESGDRKALNHEHGEVTKAGSNSAHFSGTPGAPGKTTDIFCSSTATGSQGEVQVLSPWLCLQAGILLIWMDKGPRY